MECHPGQLDQVKHQNDAGNPRFTGVLFYLVHLGFVHLLLLIVQRIDYLNILLIFMLQGKNLISVQ